MFIFVDVGVGIDQCRRRCRVNLAHPQAGVMMTDQRWQTLSSDRAPEPS